MKKARKIRSLLYSMKKSLTAFAVKLFDCLGYVEINRDILDR